MLRHDVRKQPKDDQKPLQESLLIWAAQIKEK
jgi:hypothetical protein